MTAKIIDMLQAKTTSKQLAETKRQLLEQSPLARAYNWSPNRWTPKRHDDSTK